MTLHLGQPQRKRLRPSETAISSFAGEELVYLYRNRPASAVSTQCREPGPAFIFKLQSPSGR